MTLTPARIVAEFVVLALVTSPLFVAGGLWGWWIFTTGGFE